MDCKKSIGIMGGTFDPVHYGHLVIATCARFEFQLDKVVFVPCGSPPHKSGQAISAADHRYRMVELAIAGNPDFEISRMELDRSGPSYSVDTLKSFRRSFGAETDLYFITGADAIVEILTWKRVDELVGLCSFIAATRPGYSLPQLNNAIQALPVEFQEKIFTFQIPGIAVSSTEIRERIRAGKPIKYLLPTEVENYITDHKIYGGKFVTA